MSESEATGRRYPVAMICEVFGLARSTFYNWQQRRQTPVSEQAKPGPKTLVSDETVLSAIREELADPTFSGEGYKKIHARLRHLRKLVVGKNRVLRLMRAEGLLAPVRRVHRRGDRAHSGTIIPQVANALWGTDATRFYTEEDGWCWFFGAIDHYVGDVVGHHVAKVGDRFAALDPIRQAVTTLFGAFAADVARGLKLRHDWGSQYTSHDFQGEIAFLGITSSPSFVGEPEGNGVAERFMRTLREQCLYVHRFKNLEEARAVIGAFIERYNEKWLLERHGYRTPNQVRAGLTSLPLAA
jgi:transposase InsO family protein